jgi:hypothetical protein
LTDDQPTQQPVPSQEDSPADGTTKAGRRKLSRRQVVRGTAAATGGLLAASYVKPSLRAFGVSAAFAIGSPTGSPPGSPPPPPPSGGLKGCTPGFWGNEGNMNAGGHGYWDVPNDPNWPQAQQVLGLPQTTNPFYWGTMFNSFFTPHADLNGRVMYKLGSKADGTIDANGGTAAQKAARMLVAAYLNAAFGLNYQYTTTQLKTMWTNAVANGNFSTLHTQLDTANNAGCTIPALGSLGSGGYLGTP